MTGEKELLKIKLEMEALISEREGMKAANDRDKSDGDKPFFGYNDFMKISEKLLLLERNYYLK